jgi:hypothetical protein
MSLSARVTSIERLAEFRAAFVRFEAEAREALVSAQMEIQRAFTELHERLQHWQREVRRSEDLVAQAKIELNRKKISRVFGRQPDTVEQEENLRRAQERLRQAEVKVDRCRRWDPMLQRAVGEYEGPARQMGAYLDIDLQRVHGLLQRMLGALDAYVQLKPAEAITPPAPAAEPVATVKEAS